MAAIINYAQEAPFTWSIADWIFIFSIYELACGIGLWMCKNILYGANFNNAMIGNNCDALAHFFNNAHFMSNDDDCNAHFLIELAQKLQN